MSYDISLKGKIEGYNEPLFILDVGNITWNVKRLIFECSGWDIKNMEDNGPADEWFGKIKAGEKNLMNNPDLYKEYEDPNGWGTISDTLRAFSEWIRLLTYFEEAHPGILHYLTVYVC